MRAWFARVFLVYIPLLLVLLIQGIALLILYAGKISGKDDTMVDLGSHVPALRLGWPILFLVAVIYHLVQRKKASP